MSVYRAQHATVYETGKPNLRTLVMNELTYSNWRDPEAVASSLAGALKKVLDIRAQEEKAQEGRYPRCCPMNAPGAWCTEHNRTWVHRYREVVDALLAGRTGNTISVTLRAFRSKYVEIYKHRNEDIGKSTDVDLEKFLMRFADEEDYMVLIPDKGVWKFRPRVLKKVKDQANLGALELIKAGPRKDACRYVMSYKCYETLYFHKLDVRQGDFPKLVQSLAPEGVSLKWFLYYLRLLGAEYAKKYGFSLFNTGQTKRATEKYWWYYIRK